MNKAYIKAVSQYLPETILTNEKLLAEFPEWSVEKVASKIGIAERRIAAEDEFASDMATKAANILFSEHQVSPSSIDFILLCTQSPDYFLPTTACILQHQLGIPTSAGATDFNLGCSGYIYGLAFAKGLIAANIAKNVLLLTSETYSKYMHPKDKSNRVIFGDAATATLIASDGFAEIGNFELGSDGSGANRLIVRNGAARYAKTTEEPIKKEDGTIVSDNHLYMDGAEIFTFTLDMVPPLIKSVLHKNHLTDKDIDLYIFHQANRYMLEFLRKKIGIPTDKFYLCLEKYGNTVSSTIPIALKDAQQKGTLLSEQYVLLAGFGVGFSWGGCMIKIV